MWVAVAWSLLPTLGVSVIFFVIVRSIIRSDRTERKVRARIEAEERQADTGYAEARRRSPRFRSSTPLGVI